MTFAREDRRYDLIFLTCALNYLRAARETLPLRAQAPAARRTAAVGHQPLPPIPTMNYTNCGGIPAALSMQVMAVAGMGAGDATGRTEWPLRVVGELFHRTSGRTHFSV